MITKLDVLYFDFLYKITRQQREKEEDIEEGLRGVLEPVFNAIPGIVLTWGALNSTQIRRDVREKFEGVSGDYRRVLQEEGEDVAQLGANRTVAHLQQAGMSVAYTDIDQRIMDMVEEASFEATQQTLDRMTGDVMQTISDGVGEGLSSREIADMLEDDFENMAEHELERIARTETSNYANRATYETEKELGIDYHQWITAEDERVRGQDPADRADHWILHGQIVRVGDNFSNGLEYPGDKSGPPEEIINCRCRPVPFLMPEGKTAPPGMPYFYEDDLREIN